MMRKFGSYVYDLAARCRALHLLCLHAEGVSCDGAGARGHALGVVRRMLSEQLRHARQAGEVVPSQCVLLLHLVDEHIAIALPHKSDIT